MTAHRSPACGVVLAAGAGTRFGGPKALARRPDGTPWIALAVAALADGGCDEVVVVLGAAADAALPLVPAHARAVRADEWADGVSASLRTALEAAAATDAAVVVVMPVDTPDAPAAAVARVLDAAAGAGRIATARGSTVPAPRAALVQAVYAGLPGHPVAIDRDHWGALSASLAGDRGARAYLAAHGAIEVECSDLWSGADADVPSR